MNIIKINVECFRPERECPELADPLHGQVSYTGRHFQVVWSFIWYLEKLEDEIIK